MAITDAIPCFARVRKKQIYGNKMLNLSKQLDFLNVQSRAVSFDKWFDMLVIQGTYP